MSLTLSRRVHGSIKKSARLHVESLEDRLVLNGAGIHTHHLRPSGGSANPLGYSGPVGYTPAQVLHAYAIDQITFSGGAVKGDGSGQTVAIVDAYDDPNIASDVAQFSAAFGLPAANFTKVSQTGTTSYPSVDPMGSWETEIALDVEWVHALAPKANILLVEANSSSLTDLFAAVNYARNQPGVSVVSLSWGAGDFTGENSYDSNFTTPSGHGGVTFVASSGDSGAKPEYPAMSPNVLQVGGTTLSINSSNGYVSESAWSGSGGGLSSNEAQPAYQKGVVTQSTTQRAGPDVSFDADPNSGVAVYDSYNNGTTTPWSLIGGTSFSAPAWASLIAIANQGRALQGAAALDGATGTLPAIYKLPGSDFHDITTGSTGYAASAAYDLATGRGSPIANLVVAHLVNPPGAAAAKFSILATVPPTAGTAINVTMTAQDANGNTATGYAGKVHFTSSDTAAILPADYTFTVADAGQHTFAVTFKTSGIQTLTATDSASSTVTGSTSVTVSPAPPPSSFGVTGYVTSTTAGTSHTFTVTAKNSSGAALTTYTGTIHFTSSDVQAGLPADYTFTSADKGVHSFSATLKTAGSRSISVTDKTVSTTTGTQTGITVAAAALSKFAITASATAVTAVAFSITVTAQDAYGNTVTSYVGSVAFKSSDTKATLPASYTFTSADKGIHTFNETLRTLGAQSVSVNDTKSTKITGSASVTVGSTAPAFSPFITITSGTGTSGDGSDSYNEFRAWLLARLMERIRHHAPWSWQLGTSPLGL